MHAYLKDQNYDPNLANVLIKVIINAQTTVMIIRILQIGQTYPQTFLSYILIKHMCD